MFHHHAISWSAAVRSLVRWAFGVSILTYLGLFLIEDLVPGFVSLHFNLNAVLQLAVGFGVFTIWMQTETQTDTKWSGPSRRGTLIISLAAGLLVWYRTRHFETVAVVIGLLSALIIYMFGRLLEAEAHGRDHHA